MCKTEEETRPLLANTTRVKLPHYDSGVKTQEAATATANATSKAAAMTTDTVTDMDAGTEAATEAQP